MQTRSTLFIAVALIFLQGCNTRPAAPASREPAPTITIPKSEGNWLPVYYALVYDNGVKKIAYSNPPSLCVRAGSTLSYVQIIGRGGGGAEPDHVSPWIHVNNDGIACWQDSAPWSAGEHFWEVRWTKEDGRISLASYDVVFLPSDNNNPFGSSEKCSIDKFEPDLPSPQDVGVAIGFEVAASCASGVKQLLLFVDNGTQGSDLLAYRENGAGFASWATFFDYPGDHIIEVYVVGNTNGFASASMPYTLR